MNGSITRLLNGSGTGMTQQPLIPTHGVFFPLQKAPLPRNGYMHPSQAKKGNQPLAEWISGSPGTAIITGYRESTITRRWWSSKVAVNEPEDCGARGMLGLMFWLCLYTGLCIALGALIGLWAAVRLNRI